MAIDALPDLMLLAIPNPPAVFLDPLLQELVYDITLPQCYIFLWRYCVHIVTVDWNQTVLGQNAVFTVI